MEESSVSATLQAVRQKLGLPPYAYVPMRYVPEEVFIEASELKCSNWPDLTASEIADWPSSSRDVNRETRNSPDVGLVLAFCGSVPPNNSEKLLLIRHETTGHWHECIRFAGLPLDLSVSGTALGSVIARRWYASGVNAGFAPLEDVEEYRNSLRAHGMDCNECYKYFAEGVYPVDFDDGSLERLSTLVHLEDLPFPVEHLEGACLLLLAPNSQG